MNVGILIAFSLLLSTFIFEALKKFIVGKLISLIFGIFIFYLLLFNVTYNSDWDGYYLIYKKILSTTDILFNVIADIAISQKLDYAIVYKIHIFIMGLGFIYFVSRFSTAAIFSVITFYILFQFVPLSNQIRYYVSFSLFLIAAYSLIVRKNKLVFIILSALSLSSHLSILLMFPFIYFYYRFKDEYYLPKLLLFSLVFGLLAYVAYSIFLIFSNHFAFYFEQSNLSSIAGGIFISLIWILWMLYIIRRNNSLLITNNASIKDDVKYQFLYKFSLYSIIFAPAGVIIQILCHRYIMALIIVWITFILYSTVYEFSLIRRLKVLLQFSGLVIITFFYQYFLPVYLLGNSSTKLIVEILQSNVYFYSFLK